MLTLIMLCNSIPFCYSREETQKHHSFTYKSTYFWTIINETYYDSSDFELRLYVDFIFENNQENATFILELVNTDTQEVKVSIGRKFFYNIKERMLYKKQLPIGRIHFFLDGGYTENETLILQKFGSKKIIGKVHNEGLYETVMGKKINCYEVAAREEPENYTGYFYSKIKNVLVSWKIDPGLFGNVTYEDLVLKNLFYINAFFGDIDLHYTNITFEKNQNSNLSDIIFPIIIIMFISIAFLLTFIFIRKTLKRKDQIHRGSRNRKYKK